MSEHVIDACCLINVWAAGRPEAILTAYDGVFYVPPEVRKESLSIRRADPDDDALLVPVPIDLSDALQRGLVRECQFESDAETAAYIQFAASIDDGEASCLAIAQTRGWTVATDDRKAIRLAGQFGIRVVTTPEIMKRWAERTKAPEAEVAQSLSNIERFASFRPRRNAIESDWWFRITDGE